MILGGIAACVMCGASKAGYADVSMNVPGGATAGNPAYYDQSQQMRGSGMGSPRGGMGQPVNNSYNQSMNNSQMPLNGNRGY